MSRNIFRRIHAVLVWAALVAIVVAVPASAQPCQGEAVAATAPFECVKVDLEQQIFNKVLPFDEPFLVQGDASTATRVEVRYRETDNTLVKLERRLLKVRRKVTKRSLKKVRRESAGKNTERIQRRIERKEKDATVLETKIGAQKNYLAGQSWILETSWEKSLDSSTSVFTVRIPALEPESYYSFEFLLTSSLSPDEMAAFRTRATPRVDAVLWTIPTGDIDLDQVQQLRQALSGGMAEALEGREIIAPETLFDRKHPHPVVRDTFNLLISDVIETQDDIINARGDHEDNQPLLRDHLDALRTSNALVDLKNKLAAQATENTNLRDILAAHTDALSLLELDDAALDSVFLGRDPEATSNPRLESNDPEEIGLIIKNYETTDARLEKLQKLIRELLDGQYQEYLDAMRGAGRLSSADVDLLRSSEADQPQALLDAAQEAIIEVQEPLRNVKKGLEERAPQVDKVVAKAELRAELARVLVESTTIGNVPTPQANYISADAGLMYAGEAGTTLFIGTNIYLRPINKGVPLSQRGSFRHRFAFNLGLTVQSIADNAGTRKDLFGSQALLVGGGLRFTESFRIGLGALIFNRQDPNFFVDDFDPGAVPYLSVSFDWDVAKTFKGFGDLFP